MNIDFKEDDFSYFFSAISPISVTNRVFLLGAVIANFSKLRYFLGAQCLTGHFPGLNIIYVQTDIIY